MRIFVNRDCQRWKPSVERHTNLPPRNRTPRPGMVDQQDMTRTLAAAGLRDEDGAIRAEFIEQVSGAIESGNAAILRALAADLHEADVGDLIEALDHDLRPRLVELMGREFDFTALT